MMADFAHSAPITVRTHERFTITCDGQVWRLNGRHAEFFSAELLLGNPQHFMRARAQSLMSRIESGELAGLVRGNLDGQSTTIAVTTIDFAAAAHEVERFRAWQRDIASAAEARRQAATAYDRGMNEGGEGFNPYRDL
ncbi:hypothetical protein [Methylobacterium gossipiicola]|uniref:Uncharacterized protein n=1 Tax=Methylobacterium gossipiicola TaxID=582675 RepID=A0A1I2UWP9_9HYPH|nr:hypothetical protein [Methylobacterium gossipiicola]SFG79356.1 hypothetical protein SAMN05192565_11197 [Methylobacterium gossipiicola]